MAVPEVVQSGLAQMAVDVAVIGAGALTLALVVLNFDWLKQALGGGFGRQESSELDTTEYARAGMVFTADERSQVPREVAQFAASGGTVTSEWRDTQPAQPWAPTDADFDEWHPGEGS